MLRSLYRCLLRSHPPAFRKRFADEMLSIFDHCSGRRASLKLLVDCLLSLARQWALRPEFRNRAAPMPQRASDGVPSFSTLRPFRPHTGAMIHGLVLSMAVFCTTCFAIRYSWIHVLHIRIPEVEFDNPRSTQADSASVAKQVANKTTGPPYSAMKTQRRGAVAPTQTQETAIPTSASVFRHRKHKRAQEISKPGDFHPNAVSPLASSLSAERNTQPPNPQNAISATDRVVADDVTLDSAGRHRVIDAAIANLKQYYIHPDIAQRIADALRAHEKNGDDAAPTDGAGFAALLTRQMRDVSDDSHLDLFYSAHRLGERPAAENPEALARYRQAMQQDNCTFERVEVLPHNIGYLKLNSFPDVAVCRATATAALASLNHADALIFDLRDNRGGEPEMVALIAAYLFDHPEYWYNPRENTTQQSWTHSPVPGSSLADKPVYVLTSGRTYSGAEQFSYDLKMLKRATLVGETTGGGAHAGVWHRIDDHFGMGIPETRAINPFSKADWAEVGVEPDVKVKAADALETAEKLAERTLQKKWFGWPTVSPPHGVANPSTNRLANLFETLVL